MLPPFSLVIPAYNEAERIAGTLNRVFAYLRSHSAESEVIVVDDGSVDSTSAVVQEAFRDVDGIEARLVRYEVNHGKGFAVRAGMIEAAREIALFSDADLSTPVEEAPKLLDPINAGELDIAFGSRALNRKLIGSRQAWYREQGGRVFNLLVRLGTGLPFWDTQCGFKAFRLSKFQPLLAQTRCDGFGFDVEFLYLARQAGLRIREIPVRWDHNEGSKIDYVRDSLRMAKEIAELRLR